MKRIFLMLLALAACTDSTAPTSANPVHGVLITVDAHGRCIVGGCDPPGTGLSLTLVRVLNTGTAPAFLQACGTYPALGEQQLVNGVWVNVGPAISCDFTPGPITLVAGDSVQVNWWFARGTRRLNLAVAGKSDLSDEALDTSAAFNIK
jgi:hypothetical protein